MINKKTKIYDFANRKSLQIANYIQNIYMNKNYHFLTKRKGKPKPELLNRLFVFPSVYWFIIQIHVDGRG